VPLLENLLDRPKDRYHEARRQSKAYKVLAILALIATGATLCAAGYLVRHPEWCRAALSAGGRALDLAWQVQTAPVRVAASAASAVVDGAKSVVDAIPTPW
jgi:hypothetical protein